MDILKPPLVHLDGACYRKNPGDVDAGFVGGSEVVTGDTMDEYGEDVETLDEGDDGLEGSCPEIRVTEDGERFQVLIINTTVHLYNAVYEQAMLR